MGILAKLFSFRKKEGSFIEAITPFYSGAQGLIQSGNYSKQLQANISWVYVCVRNNADGVAATPLRLYVAKQSSKSKINFPSRKITQEKLKFFEKQPYLSSIL